MADHATKQNTPIHNILSTAPQLSISQKTLVTLPEDGNVMPKHVAATIHTYHTSFTSRTRCHDPEITLRHWEYCEWQAVSYILCFCTAEAFLRRCCFQVACDPLAYIKYDITATYSQNILLYFILYVGMPLDD
jgi:hypothetical protein